MTRHRQPRTDDFNRNRSGEEGHSGFRPDLEGVLDTVNGIVWECEPETFRFRFVSGRAEALLGYPVELWTNAPHFWADHLHPDDRDRVVSFRRGETAEGRDHVLEYRMLTADGRSVWRRDICSVVCENGRPVSLGGVMVDISERKRAEEVLRVTVDRLQAVMRHAPLVLFAQDRDGVVTLCEGRGLELAHIDPKDVVGRSIPDLFPGIPGAERIRANLRRALAGEEFTDLADFAGRTAETRYQPIRDERGEPNGLIGLVIDVTERVQAEKEREAIEAQMLHAQKLESLGVLAGGIAHDFNNLLMIILGNSDLVLEGLGPGDGTREKVEQIHRAARSAADLTNQLLAYSGQRQVELGPLDLSQIVREMEDLLRVAVSKKAVLRFDLAEELPPIDGDSAQISQVVMNLVTNASDALGAENGVIDVRTGVQELRRGDLSETHLRENLTEGPYLFLEVSDTGAGMSEETRTRIFDPFFTTKFTGRGLGLATVLGIARSHRGAVRVYSEPGRGSLFHVVFPCSRRESADVAAPAPAPRLWSGSGTLLVVDDDAGVRELSGELARRLGFKVLSAEDGTRAVETFRAHADEIAAVLLDLTMPGASGGAVADELRRVRSDLPIVLMSGFSADHPTSGWAQTLGRAGFLQKPFTREDLAEALRGVLGG